MLLETSSLGFAISTPTGLVLAGASALDLDRLGTDCALRLSKLVERIPLGAILGWTVVAPT